MDEVNKLTFAQAAARCGITTHTARSVARRNDIRINTFGGIEYTDHSKLLAAVRKEKDERSNL